MLQNRKGERLFQVHTYLTDRQKAKIENRAQEMGISISAYLRFKALKG
jgi:hypothetical protein